ncbi:MAG: GntR family transcriptional regulator [Clostridia bacterium]|nr:GntR family transcriptional regulator [Clostridia bacterium]
MFDHKTVSLADQVFERLENEILSGKYAHGEILTENKLVAELGTSRTPIREAIKRLEQEHIVAIDQKGIHILGVTPEDVEDIFDIRLRIEGLAAERTATAITDEELTVLREALELQEFYLMKHDALHITSQDSRFHELIYKFTRSNVLRDTLFPLHNKTQKFRRALARNKSRAAESVEEHRAIYEAIAAHDPALASARMTEHVRRAKEHLLSGGEE